MNGDRSLRVVLLFLAIAVSAFGQTTPIRVSPEDAAKHLLKHPPPVYPPVAEQTRVTGAVILEVLIASDGKPRVQRTISGHPLLTKAAVNAVESWAYQPFEVAGKPIPVLTYTMVFFGPTGPFVEVRKEMNFQHNFGTALDSAQAALATGNSDLASPELKKAGDLLSSVTAGLQHVPERRKWAAAMGDLNLAQRNFDDAEKFYKNALEMNSLNGPNDADAPEIAATLAGLGRLYTEEQKCALARDSTNRSIAVYEKNFKKLDSSSSGLRQAYGHAIACQSWDLSKLASEQNDQSEFKKHCRKVLEFQVFVDAADRDLFVSTCRR